MPRGAVENQGNVLVTLKTKSCTFLSPCNLLKYLNGHKGISSGYLISINVLTDTYADGFLLLLYI